MYCDIVNLLFVCPVQRYYYQITRHFSYQIIFFPMNRKVVMKQQTQFKYLLVKYEFENFFTRLNT